MTRDRLLEQAIELLAIADFHSLTLKEERNQVVREAIELSRQPKQEPVIDQSAAIRIATALGWEPQRPWSQKTIEQKIEASIRHYTKEIERFKEAGDPLQVAGILEAFVMCLESIKENT